MVLGSIRVGDVPKRWSIRVNKVSLAQVNSVIDRLPRQSNMSIEQVLANSRRLKIDALIQACQEELQTRGSLNLSTTTDAEQAH